MSVVVTMYIRRSAALESERRISALFDQIDSAYLV